MAVTHPSSMRELIGNTVVDTIDGGSTFGQLLIQDSGSTTLVTLTFDSTAFGDSTAGVATANTIADGTVLVAATGTIGVIQTSTGNQVLSCSVTSSGGGGDIEISSNVFSTGQTVSVGPLTYTAPS